MDIRKKTRMFQERPSPIDERDWKAEAIYPATNELNLPKKLDLRIHLNPPRNQGQRGTCAAFTAACIKEWQEFQDCNLSDYMSPEFIYFFRADKPEEGMYGRNVMKILTTYGTCPEKYLPYKKEDVSDLTDEQKEIAANYRIKSYARVYTIEGLKKALYKNGPCYISFPVYSHRPELWRPKQGEATLGGHAMTVVGYDSSGFIIRNSWGADWNGNGCVIYPYGEFGAHWEIWTLIDDTSTVKDEPYRNVVTCLRKCFLCLQETDGN